MTKVGKTFLTIVAVAALWLLLAIVVLLNSLVSHSETQFRHYTVAGYVVGFSGKYHMYVEDLNGTLWGVDGTGFDYRQYVHLDILDPGTPNTVLDDVVRDIW